MASLTPEAFAKRWAGSDLSERSGYQQHFLDLCDVLGAPKPAEVDPHGEFYTFEKGVEKTGGGKGFAGVWFKGHFASIKLMSLRWTSVNILRMVYADPLKLDNRHQHCNVELPFVAHRGAFYVRPLVVGQVSNIVGYKADQI